VLNSVWCRGKNSGLVKKGEELLSPQKIETAPLAHPT